MARITRIDHIAVAVRDVDAGVEQYRKILGAELIEQVEGLTLMGARMKAAYLRLGDSIIVLDGAVDPEGFLARHIERRGEGLHHLGVVVDDLDGYVQELEGRGVRIPHREEVGPGRREILLSPRDVCGVVFQVIEWTRGDPPTQEERIAALKRFLAEQRDLGKA